MKDNYVVYHLHSDLSNGVTSIDSVTKPDQYIEKAKECGMQALAFSEHGSIFSWIKKKEHIEAAGMKYIHAEEFYVTKTLDEKIRDNRHCILIARNYDGVLELNKLSSISFNRQDNHYYYVPRITVDELCHTSDNIIVTTACLGGVLLGEDREMRKTMLDFVIKNKHRCFLEIQHHMVEEQIKYNKNLYKVSQKYGIPLICGTDTHALNAEHMEARSILQKAKNISFPEEDDWDLTFKTYDELIAAYEKQNSLPMNVVREAIENTNRMADMVEEFELDRSYKYPHLWKDSEKVLIQKIKRGIKIRGVDGYPNREEYAERIKYEMKAYKHNEAIDFLLLMEDIVAWCRTQDIQIGYGRGSVNGSVIAWLLGITEMDAIKHKLNFDRFMNVERVSLSDVDTDFPPSRIDDVKQYIFNKHGLYCCDIATFNTVADKGAIRDVGRALEMSLSEVSAICDTVDNEEKYEQIKANYPELFKYVELIKGVVVSVGNHPCFISNTMILTQDGYTPIQDIKVGDMVVTHNNNLRCVNNIMITESCSDIYKVKTTMLDIYATSNHPFWVRKKNKVRLRKNKDYIDTNVRYYEDPVWVSVNELQAGDMLGTPINQMSIIPQYDQYNDLKFDKGMFWWIVGRYIGDGWITHNTNRNTRYLVICCNHEAGELSDILSRLIKLNFNYRVEDRKETYRIYIKNMQLLEYLTSFGKYADGKYLNSDVLNLPIYLLKEFLNGYFGADGSYNKKENSIVFSTISKKLALGLCECIGKVYMTFVRYRIVEAHDETILGREVKCKEKYIGEFHIDARKKDRSFYEDGYVWSYCYGVEKTDRIETVYNLEVEEDHTYVANNYIVHNCGTVVAPYSIDDRMATFTTTTDAYPISQIYMKEIDGLNYVKLDLLKLDTIELIANTCKMAGIPMLTPDNMDINDVDVWNSMRDDTTQIFQWEGDTGENYIKKLLSDDNIEKFKAIDKNVDRMALLSIGNSAIRPAGASYREDLAKGVVRKSGSDAIDDFLKPTFGYLVYQCQIIEFLHSYCGFTMGEADIVRRHFAKKTGTENDIPIIKDGGYMTDEKKHYIPGFVATMKDKYGMTKEEAEETIIAFLRVIEDASSYLFSVNHSTPYSYEGYACGWLRYHYPVEFLTCALNINADNEEKTTAISAYARKVGIKIESVRFRHSIGDYSCDAQNKVIYKGLSSIKFMSDTAADDLNALKDNEYDSFVEFLIDLKDTSINSRQLEILIKLNYFNEFGDIATLLKTAELVGLLYGKKQLTPEKCEKNNIPLWIVDKHSQKKTEKMFKDFDAIELIKDVVNHSDLQKTPVIRKVGYEFEYLGYSTITDPRFDEEHWYVVDVLGAYKNMLSLYNLKYGTYRTVKYKKDKYGNQPEKGNTIKVIEYTERNKMKPDGVDENGKKKFITLDEREIVVSKFKIIG